MAFRLAERNLLAVGQDSGSPNIELFRDGLRPAKALRGCKHSNSCLLASNDTIRRRGNDVAYGLIPSLGY